jgi:oxygen-dependent protoporphyrinogen oxidase
MEIAIVGGGIAGLSCAYDLQEAGGFNVHVYESDRSLGGKVQTVRDGELLIEQGPDSVFATKPWAVDLMCEVGLEPDLMEPVSSEFSILTKGKLHNVPRALATLLPSASGALEKAGFLSAAAKRRALRESEIGAGVSSDETIASFFSRRFGRTFSSLVAEPLLAGTHAGDPSKLSMAALYPGYLGMERSHGSIARAMETRSAARGSSHRKVGFITLRGGMATFPQRLVAALRLPEIRCGTRVDRVRASGGRIELSTAGGGFSYDHVVLAVPAYSAAAMLRDQAPRASDALAGIRFVSTAIATFAFRRDDFPRPLHGNGFLVPYTDPCAITGSTWSSNKWSGRAPEELLLMRAFMGRDGGLNVDEFGDEELIRSAQDALADILKPKGPPCFSRLDRWTRSMPQYELGHLDLVAGIEEALSGLPISLIGSSYRGNSISDCVRQGREAAAKLIAERP